MRLPSLFMLGALLQAAWPRTSQQRTQPPCQTAIRVSAMASFAPFVGGERDGRVDGGVGAELDGMDIPNSFRQKTSRRAIDL